jgi:hypothetical protein
MQYNNRADLSFIYSYNWCSPEEDIQKALEIIYWNHSGAVDEDRQCPAVHDDYRHVILALAANPQTPATVLEHIANCVDCPRILEKVANNSATGDGTLRRLAEHEHSEVRRAVAENSLLDEGTLNKLVQDVSTDVRYTLAENHLLPVALLIQLSNDENPYVAYRAETTLRRVTELGGHNITGDSSWPQQSSRRAV